MVFCWASSEAFYTDECTTTILYWVLSISYQLHRSLDLVWSGCVGVKYPFKRLKKFLDTEYTAIKEKKVEHCGSMRNGVLKAVS